MLSIEVVISPVSPLKLLQYCPLTGMVSEERSAVILIFGSPCVMCLFSLSASKVSSGFQQFEYDISRWEFFACLFWVFNLLSV